MKVFVSWSGASTNRAAEALCVLLKDVLQALDPWVSSRNIAVGARWYEELSQQLGDSRYAVICVARDNLRAPWLNFEAGAVSKSFPENSVCPYLLDLQAPDIRDSPLGAFQACSADKEGTFRLVASLNTCLGDRGLKDAELRRSFDRAWPDFDAHLSQLRASVARPNEIFVSAPITSLPDSADYDIIRAEVTAAIEHLRDKFGKESVYSAVLRISQGNRAEPEKIGFQRDMKALKEAAKLVLFYPFRVPTSSLFEAGYAFAMQKPAVYFVRTGISLPFVLEGAARNSPGLVSKLEYRDQEQLLGIIDEQFDLLFPTQL